MYSKCHIDLFVGSIGEKWGSQLTAPLLYSQFIHFVAQLDEVIKRSRFVVWVAQQRGRVERCHHQHAVFFKEYAVLLGDLHIRFNEFHRSDSSEADDDFRTNEGNLIAQPFDAQILFLLQRVTILGRPAFDNVGNINIGVPVKVNSGQHLIEQLPTPADERFALQIFIFTRPLADKEHFGIFVPHAEHHVGAPCTQVAFAAAEARGLKFFPVIKQF